MNGNLIHQYVALENICTELGNKGQLFKMSENGETFTTLGHAVVRKQGHIWKKLNMSERMKADQIMGFQ